ncbi:hypothetical protein [Clostridium sp. Marseille-P2415]|uniref:hypothetical protein n=1 Tax=Clostridium sp. Marseille-P2415 TaxID=1805471 RepID=UPI003FA45B9F
MISWSASISFSVVLSVLNEMVPIHRLSSLNRMTVLCSDNQYIKIKECMLLTCGETGDTADFDGITATYKSIAAYQKWTDRGILAVPGVNARSDIRNTSALETAERLGKTF